MSDRSPRIREREPSVHNRRTYPISLNPGLCYVVLTGPEAGPLYAVSVRRLARLALGFLQTTPHGIALAFGSYFW